MARFRAPRPLSTLKIRKALKSVARYPHVNQTWLAWGHSIGSEGDEPLDEIGRFVGLVLLAPATFTVGGEELKAADGRTIRFLAVIPLLKEELPFKPEHGVDALEEKLREAGITELLNPQPQRVIELSSATSAPRLKPPPHGNGKTWTA